MLKLNFLRRIAKCLCIAGVFILSGGWGFFGHEKINRLAVFTLPPEMLGFYKKNIGYITEASVNPDRRRFSVVDEAPRHYLDIDHYGDSALYTLPRYWNDAVAKYSEDTLKAYGILPWHIHRMYYRLKDAFMMRDPDRILKMSAEIGHYIADGHVPLHTTENYNGQLTGQEGIHAFWESRLPELYSAEYDYFVGRATYLVNPQLAAWKAIEDSHRAVDSVLREERLLFEKSGDHKYSFETKGRQTQKVLSQQYSKSFHQRMNGMVERRMRAAIKLIGDFWFTAWVDAGQPDLGPLINSRPSEHELTQRRTELDQWKTNQLKSKVREHEVQ